MNFYSGKIDGKIMGGSIFYVRKVQLKQRSVSKLRTNLLKYAALYVNDKGDPAVSILKVEESFCTAGPCAAGNIFGPSLLPQTPQTHRLYITLKRFRISTTELMSKKRASSFLAGRACRLSRTSYG
jgi:hypothetical protein